MVPLRDRLLFFGGHEACLPSYEEDLFRILDRSEIWLSKGSLKGRGGPCNCHENSIRYWDSHRDTSAYATGYALSYDGFWRQHSWVVRRTTRGGRIIETTEPRVAYYGFTFAEEEAEDVLGNYL